MIGSLLAHYRVEAEIGRGGMGIVYRAVDTKLDRAVALKVLPPHALSSADDRARFYREAKAAAQLHHPHIATIFEIAEAVPADAPHGTEPRPYIAMEFVDGSSLEALIAKGPLKLAEAVRIASQISEALGAAHEAGVVHRDIKSGNVMLTGRGEAKVLDFGLAKTAASTQLTRQGSTLGTMAYMSPEQARGEEVDRRTDLWALGVILYEMIGGRLPFPADYEQAALYGILNEDPEPLTSIRTGVPMGLEWIVSKLLAKDRANRYQRADDLLVDLRTVDLSGSGLRTSRISSTGTPGASVAGVAMTAAGAATVASKARSLPRWPWLIGIGILAAIGGVLAGRGTVSAPPTPVSHTQLEIPTVDLQSPSLSEDGRYLVYPGNPGTTESSTLYVYDFQTGTRRSMDAGGGVVETSVSPDSRRLAYVANGMLQVIPIDGGTALQLAPAVPLYAIWLDNDRLLYTDTDSDNLWMYDTSRGEATELLVREDTLKTVRIAPLNRLPDGRVLILEERRDDTGQDMIVLDVESGRTDVILTGDGVYGLYSSSGHMLYSQDGVQLLARGFDLDRLEWLGAPVPMYTISATLPFDLSTSGRFVIGERSGASGRVMTRVDRAGNESKLSLPILDYEEFRINHDGTRMVSEVNRYNGPDDQIVILSLDGNTPAFQLTFSASNYEPVWSPDEAQIMFSSSRVGLNMTAIYTQPVLGVEDSRRVDRIEGSPGYIDWSADGEMIAYQEDAFGASGQFLGVYSLTERREILRMREQGIRYFLPRFHKDGHTIAYTRLRGSAEPEIWVTTADGRINKPVGGVKGNMPIWSPDGSRLYYVRDLSIYSVPVRVDSEFAVMGPERLEYRSDIHFYYDVFPDDSGFLLAKATSNDRTGVVSVIDNFFQVLEDKAPTR